MGAITEADELCSVLENLDLEGCRILSIATAGKDPVFDRTFAINYYNLMVIGPTGHQDPRWKHCGDTVYAWEIPDECIQTRLLNSDEPYLLALDDGRVLAVGMIDFGKAVAEIVPASAIPENPPADAGLVFKDIIGEEITVTHVKESSSHREPAIYMDPAPKKSIHHFVVKCSEHSLYFSFAMCAILDANDDVSSMSFAEVKEASPYLLDYFDK